MSPCAVREPRAASLPKAKERFQSSFLAGNPAASQLHLQQASNSVGKGEGRRGELVLEDTKTNARKIEFSLHIKIKVGTRTDFFISNSVTDKPHLRVVRCIQGNKEVPVLAAGQGTGSGQRSRGVSGFLHRWETKWL